MKYVILYGTTACHLCEEAEEMLVKVQNETPFAMQIKKVDVSESDILMERYGVRIPVVFIEETGAEICWPFEHNCLVSLLAAG